jgi:superfamily II DNA or RNA helicase
MPSINARQWRPGLHVRARGRRWRVDDVTNGTDCVALRLTGVEGASKRTLTILTPFDRPTAVDESSSPRCVRPRRWLHELDRVLVDVRPYGSLATTARTAIRLLPHQLEPALALFRHGVTRVLIADAVGLGKTIQAGIILRELALHADTFRALVLVPAGLRDQWSTELATHFALTSVVSDASWLTAARSDRPRCVNPWSLPGIYISSHDFVKRPEALRPLEDVSWDIVVVDEAHAATSGTDRRAAIDAIACRAIRVVLLTATPPAGDPPELAHLCRIGRVQDSERPVALFARSRADVEARPPRRSTVIPVRPSDAERRLHDLLERYARLVWKEATARNDERARLVSIILRKRALSSAGALVNSVLRRIDLLTHETPGAQQLSLPLADEDPLEDAEPRTVLAAPGLADATRERRWLSAIAEAGRLAARAETKTRVLIRLVRRVREPIIVFTEYRDTLGRLEHRLRATGRAVVTLHGGMSPSERSRATTLFNEGGRILLATDAAAEGLNLQQRCRLVVHYELPWNPSRLEQRAGRVDRMGQRARAHELALVAADTAERLVIAPLLVRARRSRQSAAGFRLLDALSESRVAEAVMSGATDVDAVAFEATPPADATPLVLDLEAADEAERLAVERRLIERSDRDGNVPRCRRPIATALPRQCRAPAHSDGLILVYLMSVDSKNGRHLHAETFTVRIAGSGGPLRPTAAWMRRALQPFLPGRLDPVLDFLLAERRSQVQEHVRALDSQARGALEARVQTIASVRRSAAQRLVQRGLFERAATDSTDQYEATEYTDTTDQYGATEHTEYTDGAPLRAGTRLLAALRIATRGWAA